MRSSRIKVPVVLWRLGRCCRVIGQCYWQRWIYRDKVDWKEDEGDLFTLILISYSDIHYPGYPLLHLSGIYLPASSRNFRAVRGHIVFAILSHIRLNIISSIGRSIASPSMTPDPWTKASTRAAPHDMGVHMTISWAYSGSMARVGTKRLSCFAT